MKRRILPMIMAVIMILSIIQVPAWAATGDDPAGEDGNPGQVSEQPVEESAEPSAPVEEEEPASNETNSLPNGETEEEPAPEERAENYVAEVNGQGFPTLQAAIDAAGEEDTITLLDNIKLDPNYAATEEHESDDEGKLVPLMKITKDITLDLSEYSIGWDLEKLGDADSIWYTLCFMDVDSATVRFTGNGTIDTEANYCNSYGINITNGGAAALQDHWLKLLNAALHHLCFHGGDIHGRGQIRLRPPLHRRQLCADPIQWFLRRHSRSSLGPRKSADRPCPPPFLNLVRESCSRGRGLRPLSPCGTGADVI